MNTLLPLAGVPKGAMLTHGNLVADSAGMVRVTYVSPGVIKTAFGTEETTPGKTKADTLSKAIHA